MTTLYYYSIYMLETKDSKVEMFAAIDSSSPPDSPTDRKNPRLIPRLVTNHALPTLRGGSHHQHYHQQQQRKCVQQHREQVSLLLSGHGQGQARGAVNPGILEAC